MTKQDKMKEETLKKEIKELEIDFSNLKSCDERKRVEIALIQLRAELRGFLAGKSQATKEILEEEIRFLEFQFGNEKGYDVIKMRIRELKQQLQKLGEERS